jgi:hypothetical protein
VSAGSATRSWKSILREIEKCIVLCLNCHAREHDGVWNWKLSNENTPEKFIEIGNQLTLDA